MRAEPPMILWRVTAQSACYVGLCVFLCATGASAAPGLEWGPEAAVRWQRAVELQKAGRQVEAGQCFAACYHEALREARGDAHLALTYAIDAFISAYVSDPRGSLAAICRAEQFDREHVQAFGSSPHDDSGIVANFSSARGEAGEWSCVEVAPPPPCPLADMERQDEDAKGPQPVQDGGANQGSPPPSPPRSGLQAGATLVGLGVASAGAGAAGAGARVYVARRDGFQECTHGCSASDHDLDIVRRQRDLILGVGLGVGAAMILVGAVLLARMPATKIVAAPHASARGVGLTVGGRF